jgi:sugar lactone lactonase YvrE
MTLGEKNVPGQDETHFGLPQDVAFLPDGRILIADGYENGRVMVMDADAKYLTEFGERGEGLGQFNVVHGIAVGPDGRIFVVDRDNLRVQVFSQSNGGSYHPEFAPVEEWTGFGMPLDIMISGDRVWVTDLRPAKIVQLDLDGNRQYSFNLPAEGPFRYLEMHSFAVDSDGNLYGADNQNARIQKFVPKAGIDRSLLVGQGYARR